MRKFIIFAFLVAVANAYAGKRIHFNDIRALTFRKGAYTTSRRLAPVPQLKCVGGPCHEFDINSIQCRNIGHDGQLPQWECKTPNLSKGVKIDTNEVVCEGYDHAGDSYVLHGSCGLEYSLKRVHGYHGHAPRSLSYTNQHSSSVHYGFFGTFLTIAGCAFAFVMLMSLCVESSVPQGRNTYYRPDAYGSCSNYGYGLRYSQPGGFWTGAGVGGLAGYWAGRRSRPSNRYSSPGWGSSWGSSSAQASRTATSFAGSRSR